MRQSALQIFLLASVCFMSFSCGKTGALESGICKEDSLRHAGKEIGHYTLTNRNGMTVKVTNFGASLTYATAPDRNGVYEPVVLGLDSLRYYTGRQPKLGATVGRFANRIRDGGFTLDGKAYKLDRNNNAGHCIHGGYKGFHLQTFDTDTLYAVKDTSVITFSYLSKDGEGGFPGNLHLSVSYRLTSSDEIIIGYTATTDKPTVVNFTNHSYFNLTGCKAPVLGHNYRIFGDFITPADKTGVPTGELMPVDGTEYDFKTFRTLSELLGDTGKGYDTNYVLGEGSLKQAAIVTEPESGRVLEAYTTEPGMQFYTPAADLSYLKGHDGRTYGRYFGFCLEMQHFPDSPNLPHFPTTVLRPGEVYRQTTIYRFSTDKDKPRPYPKAATGKH